MTTFSTTITSTTTTQVATVNKKRDFYIWKATVGVSGTFGGTTVTYQWSPDNGTTKYPITSAPGVAVSSTAADAFNIELGNGDKNSNRLLIYAVTTGGSGISITVNITDDN